MPWAEQVENGGGEVDLNQSLHFSSGSSSQKTPDPAELDGHVTPPYFASSARDLTGSSFENDDYTPVLTSSSVSHIEQGSESEVGGTGAKRFGRGRGRKPRRENKADVETVVGNARDTTPEPDDLPRVGAASHKRAPRDLNSNPSLRRVDVGRQNAAVCDVTEHFDGLVIRNQNLPHRSDSHANNNNLERGQNMRPTQERGQNMRPAPERGQNVGPVQERGQNVGPAQDRGQYVRPEQESNRDQQRQQGRRDPPRNDRRDERLKSKESRTAWEGNEGGRGGGAPPSRGGEPRNNNAKRGTGRGESFEGGRGGAMRGRGGVTGHAAAYARERSPYAAGREVVERTERRKAIFAAQALRNRREKREEVTSSEHDHRDANRKAPSQRLGETQSCPNQQQSPEPKRFSNQRRNPALRARSDTESTNEHNASSDDDAVRRRATKVREAQQNRETAAMRRKTLQALQEQQQQQQAELEKSPHQSDTESCTDGGDVTPVNLSSPPSDRSQHKHYYDPYRLYERKDRMQYEEELRMREERRAKGQPYQAQTQYPAGQQQPPKVAYEAQQASSARLASLPPRFHPNVGGSRRAPHTDRRPGTPGKGRGLDGRPDKRNLREGRSTPSSDREGPGQRRGSFDDAERMPRPATCDGNTMKTFRH